MRHRFGILDGSHIKHEYRDTVVMRNSMIVDVLGNAAVYADLSPVHAAAIQAEAGNHGVLLALDEYNGQEMMWRKHAFKVQFGGQFDSGLQPTPTQYEALTILASAADDEQLDPEFVEASKNALPAIWYSDIAFVGTGLFFGHKSLHGVYRDATKYVRKHITDRHEQAHRDRNAAIRSKLADMGYDMAQVPKSELSEQRRAAIDAQIAPEFIGMLARAEMMQTAHLPRQRFAITAARAALEHLERTTS